MAAATQTLQKICQETGKNPFPFLVRLTVTHLLIQVCIGAVLTPKGRKEVWKWSKLTYCTNQIFPNTFQKDPKLGKTNLVPFCPQNWVIYSKIPMHSKIFQFLYLAKRGQLLCVVKDHSCFSLIDNFTPSTLAPVTLFVLCTAGRGCTRGRLIGTLFFPKMSIQASSLSTKGPSKKKKTTAGTRSFWPPHQTRISETLHLCNM